MPVLCNFADMCRYDPTGADKLAPGSHTIPLDFKPSQRRQGWRADLERKRYEQAFDMAAKALLPVF